MFLPVGLLTIAVIVKDPNKVKFMIVIYFFLFLLLLNFPLYYEFVVLLNTQTNRGIKRKSLLSLILVLTDHLVIVLGMFF